MITVSSETYCCCCISDIGTVFLRCGYVCDAPDSSVRSAISFRLASSRTSLCSFAMLRSFLLQFSHRLRWLLLLLILLTILLAAVHCNVISSLPRRRVRLHRSSRCSRFIFIERLLIKLIGQLEIFFGIDATAAVAQQLAAYIR